MVNSANGLASNAVTGLAAQCSMPPAGDMRLGKKLAEGG